MGGRCIFVVAVLAATPAMADSPPTPRAIELAADAPLTATIDGHPAALQLVTGFVDRLTLSTEFVAANGIKPAAIMGNADISFWGRREIKGKNRPLSYSIGGASEKGRAFWFINVPQPANDGQIGPFALPFERITVRMAASQAGEQAYSTPYFGDANTAGTAGHVDPTFRTAVTFAVERRRRFPLASAATGAALAAAYGGALSGEAWNEEIAFGISRPVRLLTLDRPFAIGPLRFTRIAVRVRGSIDAGGSGAAIAEANASDDADPAEIVVTGVGKNARRPIFTFAIDRGQLDNCSTITFDKIARAISLSCRPAKAS